MNQVNVIDNNTLNTHINYVNQGLIVTCEDAMEQVNNEQPNLNFNAYVDEVLLDMPAIHEDNVLQYIYYNLNVLNMMNVYLSEHNIPAVYNIVTLVIRYRRVYVTNHITNNRNRILVRQD